MPAWVMADEVPLAVTDSDAPFADHDDEQLDHV